ncbi:hypothetical protein B0A50_03084 [Salinomyces thailandicus]|uniref:Uncharacterized protein n=1 Tax=Salinomyces thailandicus TaxID=706561 RepID=A0A4U0TJB2_9PEZI|nr:hypothetical protein B0A50_08820 [Salinomyces thailandica]TKA21647.1 hypothetical protein B0A50_08805 [Salinomyces thailandica]TKA22805.1 hypothetical protein B0A50_07907 [Salinomyces thailandica]TKA23889.1 hypothetical protein B0A50_07024 [Salinomyces thailandica]TKA24374.1 hypothetical protein B0A50_06694 [Salinomyces thailandica]
MATQAPFGVANVPPFFEGAPWNLTANTMPTNEVFPFPGLNRNPTDSGEKRMWRKINEVWRSLTMPQKRRVIRYCRNWGPAARPNITEQDAQNSVGGQIAWIK